MTLRLGDRLQMRMPSLKCCLLVGFALLRLSKYFLVQRWQL